MPIESLLSSFFIRKHSYLIYFGSITNESLRRTISQFNQEDANLQVILNMKKIYTF